MTKKVFHRHYWFKKKKKIIHRQVNTISIYKRLPLLADKECLSGLQQTEAGKWDDLYLYAHNKMRNCLHK